MVLNDSFSLFSSPAALRRANESFNDSFSDKNSVAPATIFRTIQKEHDQISSILRFHPPTPTQYQNSLIELVSLFERAEDQATIGLQKLIVAVFLKLSANILNATGKPKYQALLYRLAQLIADSIPMDLGEEAPEIEQKTMKKWVDRVIIECTIHLIDYPNFQLDLDFNIDNVVEEMGLTNGKFQFVRSTVLEVAREMGADLTLDLKFSVESRFTVEHLADEHTLQLILWFFLRWKSMLNGDFLPSLFPTIPLTPNAQELMKSPVSLLDVKLYLVSLSVVASTTTESGMSSRCEPLVAAQLALTKHQKDCWKAVVDTAAGDCRRPPTALSRLRTSQLVDAVRLTSDGSEDVRVLFETWKRCLQPSAAHDEPVFEAIKVLTEKYRTKMNAILAYGPFYSSDPSSFVQTSSTSSSSSSSPSLSGNRRDLRTLFPLQFDYEFVGTTEAGHIGVVINSVEGYLNLIPDESDNRMEVLKEEEEEEEEEAGTDDSFRTAYSAVSSGGANHSQFFSPLKPRPSIEPGFEFEKADNSSSSSFTTTQRLILTPTLGKEAVFRQTSTPAAKTDGLQIRSTFVTPTKPIDIYPKSPQKSKIETPILFQNEDEDASFEEEEEIDELEMALLESTKKHEIIQKSREFAPIVQAKTPTKYAQDAQTDTSDDMMRYESSGSESIVSVKMSTPSRQTEIRNEERVLLESDELEDSEEEELELEEKMDELADYLTEEQDEQLFEQLLHGLYANFADARLKKMGIEDQKFSIEKCTEEDVMRRAEEKLTLISNQINETIRKLEGLAKPIVTTITTITTQCQRENLKLLEEIDEHDARKCLGCQSDEIQEAALRCLERMALDWDAEGNDYLYE